MTTGQSSPRQVAVITGATGGMGQVLVVALARSGWDVVALVRDKTRASLLEQLITEQNCSGGVEMVFADLSNREGILAATRDIRQAHDSIHLLINNAGAHFPDHRLSADGIEMHIAVDYLGFYGMTTLLRRELACGRARVVNVASDTLRDVRRVKIGRARPATIDSRSLSDLASLSPKHRFVPFEAYGRAKLLTVAAGFALADRLGTDGVTVNSVHPGIVATGIVDDLIPAILRPIRSVIRRSMLTPEQGAESILRLALDARLAGTTGRYFVRDTETLAPPVAYDTGVQNLLVTTTDRFFGIVD